MIYVGGAMDNNFMQAHSRMFLYLAMAISIQRTHGTVFAAALVEELGVDPDCVRWALIHACRIERIEREKRINADE